MSLNDARLGAWLSASRTLDSAEAFRNEWRKQFPDLETPLPNDYWAMMFGAQVLATLASSTSDVGMMAGNILVEEANAAERLKAAFGEARGRSDDDEEEAEATDDE